MLQAGYQMSHLQSLIVLLGSEQKGSGMDMDSNSKQKSGPHFLVHSFLRWLICGGMAAIILAGLLRGRLFLGTLESNIGLVYLNRALTGHASWSPTKGQDRVTLSSAERWLRRATTRAEDNNVAWWALGVALAAGGKEAKAVPAWRAAGLTAQYFIATGEEAWKARQYEEALTWYERAVSLEPGLADGWYHIGVLFQQENQWEQAFQALNRAIELDPGLAGAYIAQARVLALGYGEYEAARAKAEEGLGIALGDKEVLYQAAQFFLAIRDNARAEELFRTALSLDLDNLYVWIGVGQSLFAQERFGEALEAFEQASFIQTGTWQDAIAHVWLGRTYIGLDRPYDALREFEMAAQLHPADSNNFVWLGDAYQLIGEEDKASEAYQQALSVNPTNEWALERISDLQNGE
jgi:tetratricopeptide (TPR) repeat protein